jgi:hypothetical protein
MQNRENQWNATNLLACEHAKTHWTKVSSRRGEGIDGYKIEFARDNDAFPSPTWPTQSLEKLILTAFDGRMITDEKHPALLRLLGAKQSVT